MRKVFWVGLARIALLLALASLVALGFAILLRFVVPGLAATCAAAMAGALAAVGFGQLFAFGDLRDQIGPAVRDAIVKLDVGRLIVPEFQNEVRRVMIPLAYKDSDEAQIMRRFLLKGRKEFRDDVDKALPGYKHVALALYANDAGDGRKHDPDNGYDNPRALTEAIDRLTEKFNSAFDQIVILSRKAGNPIIAVGGIDTLFFLKDLTLADHILGCVTTEHDDVRRRGLAGFGFAVDVVEVTGCARDLFIRFVPENGDGLLRALLSFDKQKVEGMLGLEQLMSLALYPKKA